MSAADDLRAALAQMQADQRESADECLDLVAQYQRGEIDAGHLAAYLLAKAAAFYTMRGTDPERMATLRRLLPAGFDLGATA